MASTSVYLPPHIVAQLDCVAAERGASRNRVILQACEDLLALHRGDWPAGFFETALAPGDLDDLQWGGQEMEAAILAARRNRPITPL